MPCSAGTRGSSSFLWSSFSPGLFPFDRSAAKYGGAPRDCGLDRRGYHNLVQAGIVPESLQPCAKGVAEPGVPESAWFAFDSGVVAARVHDGRGHSDRAQQERPQKRLAFAVSIVVVFVGFFFANSWFKGRRAEHLGFLAQEYV